MKAAQLREQSEEELRQMLTDGERELVKFRATRKTGDASEQPLRMRSLRREIARMKTVLRERGVLS